MILLSKEFTKQIETILVPYFSEHGFSQQDIANFRRHKKPFIHCVWLQERSDRKALCVNFGVHLEFLPLGGGIKLPKIDEIIQPACDIRERLKGKNDVVEWWPTKPAKKQVESIKKLFQEKGIPFFERYTLFPDAFKIITVEDIKSGNALKILPEMTRKGMALLLARIYEYIGEKSKAVQFAEYGLEVLKEANPIHIRPMKKNFEDIIRRCQT